MKNSCGFITAIQLASFFILSFLICCMKSRSIFWHTLVSRNIF